MKRIIVIVTLVIVVAAALGFSTTLQSQRVSYITAPAEIGDLVSSISATGTVHAVQTIKVGSQLSGQVAASIKSALVEKAKADLENAKAAHLVAREREAAREATLTKFRREYERKQALSKRGSVSASELDEVVASRDAAAAELRAVRAETLARVAEISSAEAALDMTQAEQDNAVALIEQRSAALEQAEIELERTIIRAPIDGIIIGRDIDRGQTVAASLESPTLFEIADDLSQMEVHAKVDEADIGAVEVAQPVEFGVDAYPGHRFGGRVVQIRKSPRTVQNVVIFTVVISAENLDLRLLPGMTASVRIVTRQKSSVLKVPNTALRFRPPQDAERGDTRLLDSAQGDGAAGRANIVWKLDRQSRPTPVEVRTGERDGFSTEIVAGEIAAGDGIVIGSRTVEDGSSVFGLRLNF
jgi:HlyD family secretion protein